MILVLDFKLCLPWTPFVLVLIDVGCCYWKISPRAIDVFGSPRTIDQSANRIDSIDLALHIVGITY